MCIFGSHAFVPKSWMCKKQTSGSHSSTESEIISLDAGSRLDGIPSLDLWDLIVTVLRDTNQNRIEQGNPLWAATRKPCRTIIMNNLLKALSQHATQSVMTTKLALLKSGKLTHRWVIERGNPL